MELGFVLFLIAILAEVFRPHVPKGPRNNSQNIDVNQYDVLHGGEE